MIRSYGGQNSDCQTPYLCHCSLTSPVIKTSGYLKELIRNIVPLTIKALFNIKLVIFCADLRIYKQCFATFRHFTHFHTMFTFRRKNTPHNDIYIVVT